MTAPLSHTTWYFLPPDAARREGDRERESRRLSWATRAFASASVAQLATTRPVFERTVYTVVMLLLLFSRVSDFGKITLEIQRIA
jgi:hypothetical protein